MGRPRTIFALLLLAVFPPCHADTDTEFLVVTDSRPGCGLSIPCEECGGVTSRQHAQRLCAETAGCVGYEWSGKEGLQLGDRPIPYSLYLCALPAVHIPARFAAAASQETMATWIRSVLPRYGSTWEYGILADRLAGFEHEVTERQCPEPDRVTVSALRREFFGTDVAECLLRCREQVAGGDWPCAAVAVHPAGDLAGGCQLLPTLPDGCLPAAAVRKLYGRHAADGRALDDKAVLFLRAGLLHVDVGLPGGFGDGRAQLTTLLAAMNALLLAPPAILLALHYCRPVVPRAAPVRGGVATHSQLRGLDGLRWVAACWVICGHHQPRMQGGAFVAESLGRLLSRAPVAVNFCVLLSGFTTHYATFSRAARAPLVTAGSSGSCCRWAVDNALARRLLRVAGSYYPALVLVIAGKLAVAVTGGRYRLGEAVAGLLARYRWWPELFLIHAWWPEIAVDTVLQPSWTLSTLMLPWVLYPLVLQPALLPAGRKPLGAVATTVGMFACYTASVTLPLLFTLTQPRGPTIWQYRVLYYFPPARLPDFILGALGAHALQLAGPAARAGWPVVVAGDLAAAGVVSVVCGWPSQGGRQHELFLISGLGPLLCVAVAAVAADDRPRGMLQRVAAHPVAVTLGGGSFAAYLFAMAWVALFDAAGAPIKDGFEVGGGWFPLFFVCVWAWASWWTQHVDAPIGKLLRARPKTA
jgi:peptidoglycan/LPS O-acetylase OafA/YrhL